MASDAVRLQKILSMAGVASRRASEKLIERGRVTVNGRTIVELGTKADPWHDDIRVDGTRIRPAERQRYILLNKPRGYVTTRSDPQRRPTVIDLLEGVGGYVYPVGRLDFDSDGLLLLTNDGDLAQRLLHPRHQLEREYHARVRGTPDRQAIDRLRHGIVLEGRRTAPARVRLLETGLGASADQALLSLVLYEGRTRQVRNMCEAVGHPVVRLRRVRFGPLADATLRPGEFRDLTPREVDHLRRVAGPGGSGSAASRVPLASRNPRGGALGRSPGSRVPAR
ncbi:MAG: pseudouridine synthase [Acidobacteriota bacterium]